MAIDLYERNMNAMLIKISRLLNTCDEVTVRGLKTKELRNFSFTLMDPTNCIITLPARKLDMIYLTAETLWYLSGSLKVNIIGLYASLWNDIASIHGLINSNYGNLIFYRPTLKYLNQYQFVIAKIIEDIHTRKATITTNSLFHKGEIESDYPCTMHLQFIVRNNYLNMYVYMRSNDLIYGTCYDVPFFCLIHQMVYLQLFKHYPELKLGYYTHHAQSLHVYEKHYKMIKKLSNATLKNISPTFLKVDDEFIMDLITGKHKSNLMRYLYNISRYPERLKPLEI